MNLMQTWTDNLRLEERDHDAALITTVSPGLSISANNSFLRGNLDYSLNGIAYVKSYQPSRLQNSLMASAQAELISRTLFVDLRANIGQQNASAFGVQSTPTLGSAGSVSSLANANQRETTSFAVSPSVRGRLGGFATFGLRGDLTRTEVRGSSLGDSRSNGGSLSINQANAGVLGWWLQTSTQQTSNGSAMGSRDSTLRVGLNYRPDVDWSLSVNAGRERSNYLGNGMSSGVTGGATVQWTPTPRTSVDASWQHHDYGDNRSLNFSHRMSRLAFTYSDTHSVSLGNTGASGGARSNYDLYDLLFRSRQPDPVKRDVEVRAFLQSMGLSPDALAASGFLSSGPSQLHSRQMSIALQGVRSSLSAQVGRSVSGRLGSNQNQGDLANTAYVEQRSYSLAASYQLTPTSTVSLTASRQNTEGDATSPSTRLSSVLANWNARFGTRLSAQLGARHSRFAGVTRYTENAVYASLTQQF